MLTYKGQTIFYIHHIYQTVNPGASKGTANINSAEEYINTHTGPVVSETAEWIHTNTFTSLTISTMLGGGGQEDLEPDLSAAACCQQLCTVDLDPSLVSLSPQMGRGKGA